MQVIFDFFVGLLYQIKSLFGLLISFVSDIVYIIKIIGIFFLNIPNYFAWLPSAFVTLIVTIFSIVVIYKVIGREG